MALGDTPDVLHPPDDGPPVRVRLERGGGQLLIEQLTAPVTAESMKERPYVLGDSEITPYYAFGHFVIQGNYIGTNAAGTAAMAGQRVAAGLRDRPPCRPRPRPVRCVAMGSPTVGSSFSSSDWTRNDSGSSTGSGPADRTARPPGTVTG